MGIYITWQEKEQKFQKWEYVGNGENRPLFEEVTVTKKALYSNEITDELIAKAARFIETDRPEGKIELVIL